MNDALIWLGIVFCILQSALFSGSNIAVFSLSRLRLEAAAAAGDASASSALELRRDANFTLVTILIGNVAINVALTMLADSVMAGVLAFFFSTVVITALGEIAPQAYFSRNALRAVAIFAPVLRFYRMLLWPVAMPTARLLDAWVGTEAVPGSANANCATPALPRGERGERSGPRRGDRSHQFPCAGRPPRARPGSAARSREHGAAALRRRSPGLSRDRPAPDDPFVGKLAASRKQWIVLTDEEGRPRLLLNAHTFLQALLVVGESPAPVDHCHRPVVLAISGDTLDTALGMLALRRDAPGGHDETVILLWSDGAKRMITGSDVLRRLLSGMRQGGDVAGDGAQGPTAVVEAR